jgi:hypothetical protein
MNSLSDPEFNAWLDQVALGEALPPGLPARDAADLALARRLLALRAAPPPRLLHRIREAPVAAPARTWPRLRSGVAAAAVALLLLAFTLAFTPAGTWAQTVIQRFGVIFLPGSMPGWSGEPSSIVPTRSPIAFTSEAQVQAGADFPLRWPRDFPFERDEAILLGYMLYAEDGAWIESLYGDAETRYLEVQVFWRRRPGPWPTGDARLEPVTVAGHPGLWGEELPPSFIAGARSSLTLKGAEGTVTRVGKAETTALEPINLLLWEEGDALYILIDPHRRYSQDELLRTAESAY